MMETDMWTYREPMTEPLDVKGFDVEAMDGSIGKIDEATYDVRLHRRGYGPMHLGRKVVLPSEPSR
jgi:hypothetical protein